MEGNNIQTDKTAAVIKSNWVVKKGLYKERHHTKAERHAWQQVTC
jgi:hypothetical protein